jgi:hypothetical protein
MKLERSITTELDERTIAERLTAYFARAGYQQSISQPHLLAFRRGKFLSLTAKGCPVHAVIQINAGPDRQTLVRVTLEIDTTGQLVLKREREYWREQLNEIEMATLSGQGTSRAPF